MTNYEMARMDLDRAEAIVEEAKHWMSHRRWNLVVRRSQETVELALKAALRWAGLEVPHLHDVGGLLKRYRHRFPSWFGEEVSKLASISKRLRGERELNFYGDEETETPPEELYFHQDAEKALKEAEFVLDVCRSLISEAR
jgi:HEPN domain-containing protein